ncbi:hypothetical protein [Bacillus cereus]|uniref:hypothetical protein n=1 Tax=Bacillus cereus TaxID=1396 RepID=UPI00032D7713|nr:hypothetical protein [Bacillus cereus]EOO11488.1 hypothetical protein IG9_05910 [Bacillus cereus HuA2-9]
MENKSKETRSEKFRRISKSRMSRIFVNMNLMANLSNKKNYNYIDEEINELFEAYEKKGREVSSYFDATEGVKGITEANFVFKVNLDNEDLQDTKRVKFRRLAEQRMSRIFHDMNLIANLSNKSHYTYTPQEVDELFQAYEEKGERIKLYFEPLLEEFKYSNE